MIRKALLIALFCALLAFGVAGCASQTAEESAPAEGTESEVAEDDLDLRPLTPEEEKYKITIGYYNCDHMIAGVIMREAGLFEKYGLMNVEVVGGGNVPTAMSAGQMDAGYIGAQGLMKANMNGAPIIMAADNHTSGSYYILVSNDIEDPVKDLMGAKVAFGTDPKLENAAWAKMAPQAGLPLEGENYDSYEMSIEDAYFAMKAGEIKASLTCDPWASYAEYEGVGRVIAVNDYIPGTEYYPGCCGLSMSIDFYENYPELARRLILAHVDALKLVYTDPMFAGRVFAEEFGIPEEVAYMTIWKKTVAEGRTMMWSLDPERYQRLADWDFENTPTLPDRPNTDDFIRTDILDSSGAQDFDTYIEEEVDSLFPVGMSYDDWKAKAETL